MALLMALLSCYTPLSPMLVSAAGEYKLVFVDGIDESDNKTIIEGTTVKIRATLPSGYTFSDPPFKVKKAGIDGDASQFFDIKGNNSVYTLKANDTSSGAGRQEYALNAIYKANMTQGDGNGKYVDVNNADNNSVYSLKVETAQPLAVIEDSKLSFKVDTAEDAKTGVIGFSPVIEATGAFDGFQNAVITATAFGSGVRSSVLTLQADKGTSLSMTVEFTGTTPIKKDTEFSIYFRKKAINPLIATIVSEQIAVDDVTALMQRLPIDPEVVGDDIPFILLDKNDTLTSIRKNFQVRTKVHYYNQDFNIKWTWTADKPEHQGNVDITQAGRVDIINRPLEDMDGTISAEVSLGKSKSTVMFKEPIKIYGTGEPVTVVPVSQQTGVPGKPDNVDNSIKSFPKNMDVYHCKDVDIAAYPYKPKFPYVFSARVTYGSGRGEAKKMIIRSDSQGGELEAMVDGDVVPYNFGTDLENLGASRSIKFRAVKKGQMSLIFEFYNNAGELMGDNTVKKQINIEDNSPKTIADLESLDVHIVNDTQQDLVNSVYPSGKFPYDFATKTNIYNLTVPNKAEKIKLRASLPPATDAKKAILFKYDNVEKNVNAGSFTDEIPLEERVPKEITATVTAEDGSTNTYTINVTRAIKEGESRLDELHAYRTDMPAAEDLITTFDASKPEAQQEYIITVPYIAKELEIKLKPKSPWINGITFTPKEKTTGFWLWSKKVMKFDLKCDYNVQTGEVIDNINIIKIQVEAEDGIATTTYTIKAIRLPPNIDNSLKDIQVTDKKGVPIPFDDGQTFDKEVRDYAVHIPYSASAAIIKTAPTYAGASKITLTKPIVYGGGVLEMKPRTDNELLEFRNLDISQNIKAPVEARNDFTYTITATAESGAVTAPPYTIHFIRNAADDNTNLKDIALTDNNGAKPEAFIFDTIKQDYTLDVPYEIYELTVAPILESKLSSVKVNGQEISEKTTSYKVKLPQGQAQAITILVTAENLATKAYTITVTRGAPSGEADLQNLVVNTLPMKPIFNHNVLMYEIVIPNATKGITITPTLTEAAKMAKITVDGKAVKSGEPSQEIKPLDVMTKVQIVVESQDTKKKKVYTISIRDENRIEKNSNADLAKLNVFDGALSPRFKQSIIDYDIALKNGTRSLEITALPADENAKMEVTQGTRKLGNYDNVYSSAIVEDMTEFKINVTATDGTKKVYDLKAYRNNEEKLDVYKPITSDMVNWDSEENPIYVDITKYTVVKAEVFNKLKTEYPDKSIVFEGNDYSLQINGKDLATLIPNTEEFDFGMTFSSPNDAKIIDLIHSLDARNAGISPVILHFGYHGALPASMQLTVSLGGFYKNMRVYWNYYNEERGRIDYYGYVGTNAQGTFSLPLTHMSEYPVTTSMVYGSENKVGKLGTASENLGNANTSGKRNPQTGKADR